MIRFSSAFWVVALLPALAQAENLILGDQLLGQLRTVVYELPEEEGRAEAIQHIELVRNRQYPQAEIIDAASLDDASLREKIKGTFFLYTTFSEKSRLLRLVTQPLPLRIEAGTVRWGDVSGPAKELGVIFVGKNPYANGYSVVCAAGSNSLLAKGYSFGPVSYVIYRGAEPIQEGFYDRNFVSREGLSLAEATEDVEQFFSTLERVHPNLLAKTSEQEYSALKQQTLRDLSTRIGKNGQINWADLAYGLYYAAAFFWDGHTSVHWNVRPTALKASGKRYPPFWLDAENGRFRIVGAADASLRGAELLAVNGTAIDSFLKPALDRIPGETSIFRAAALTNQQPFWYFLTDLFHADSYELKLRDEHGNERKQTVQTLGVAGFEQLRPQMLRSQGTRIEFFEGGRTARLEYPAFIYSDSEKKKIDQIFDEIKDRKTTDLVVDLRGNGGGNSKIGDYMFGYLYDGEFRLVSKLQIKVSSDILASHLLQSQYAAQQGKTITWEPKESREFPKPASFFAGRKYLLVDNRTFSAAMGFAVMFRDYEVGKILGYETGGVPICFIDSFPFTLKNSGFGCTVSYKHTWPPKPRPGDDEHGVLPDVPLNAELLAPYRNETDPVIAFTLAYIRKTREKALPNTIGGHVWPDMPVRVLAGPALQSTLTAPRR